MDGWMNCGGGGDDGCGWMVDERRDGWKMGDGGVWLAGN